jgi:uncharacterized membrane protein YhhN
VTAEEFMLAYAVLIVPIILGIYADSTDYLPAKMGVPLSCALIVLGIFFLNQPRRRDLFWLVAAFVFSALGDYFLSNKRDNESYFVIGIGLYFLAHCGYLSFALCNGRVNLFALGLLLASYLTYYFLKLGGAIDDRVLSGAVLLYLLISCVAVAAGFGLRWTGWMKWSFVFGICMILLSDTAISFNEFLNYRDWTRIILPTYYLAHITITLAVLRRSQGVQVDET